MNSQYLKNTAFFKVIRHNVAPTVIHDILETVRDRPELDMDWIHPWIGLDWIGLDWIGSEVLYASLFFRIRKRLRL